jgi:titin
MFSQLKGFFRPRAVRRSTVRAPFRPRVKALEERWLPSTFTVTNVNDSGAGSLRQAILDADAGSGNTIAFDIPGSGVHTITPLSPLPALTAAGTLVDGYTQPGAKVNTKAHADNAVLRIFLSGGSAGSGADGLDVTGGSCTVRGVAIGNFAAQGVHLSGAGGNVIEGDFLGTDATGKTAAPNGSASVHGTGYGVYVENSSPSNVIGGTTPDARNVLSGNLEGAVGLNSPGNVVEGNFVGTDVTGLAAVAGEGAGVVVVWPGNTVGGGAPGAGNVIAGNGADGVLFYDATLGIPTPAPSYVQGNLIGLGADGTTALANVYGIYVALDSRNVQIGGTSAADRNVISANVGFGIITGAADLNLTIQGNYIGTDASGTLARGNGYFGIEANGSDVLIGGTAAGAGNLISGQNPTAGGGGIALSAGSNVVVQHNLIGTDRSGNSAIPNGVGIWINGGASGDLVGGTTAAARNLIAGNTSDGVQIEGPASDNVVEGNYIGTNAAGTGALGNGVGVIIYGGATGNTVGGTTAGARNLISGSGKDGVQITDGTAAATTGNVVEGNYIGLARDGSTPLPNGGNGVTINASGNLVGGTAKGAGNLIEDNTGAGADVAGGTGDSILGNGIYGNGGGGIVLAPGANNNQPAPQITFAKAESTETAIEGVLVAAANTTYTLEFFADPSGTGQGQTFLMRVTVTTDAAGVARFIVNLPVVPAGQFLTATATDPGGDTSAFSNPIAVS